MSRRISTIRTADQLALRIEKEVQQQMDHMLESIKTIATEYNIADKDKKSPFRNVLAVAVEPSSSLEIIKNYIRYQVGRGSNASPIWSLRRQENQKLFAQELVSELDNLSADVTQILDRVTKSLIKPSEEAEDEASDEVSEDTTQTSANSSQSNSNDDETKEKPIEVSSSAKNDLGDKLPSDQEKILVYLGDNENQKAIRKALHLELAQLYLGYLAREHTAQVGEKEAKGSSLSSSKNTSEKKSTVSKDKPKIPNKPVRN